MAQPETQSPQGRTSSEPTQPEIPDPERDGYSWGQLAATVLEGTLRMSPALDHQPNQGDTDDKPEATRSTIATEAMGVIYGDRQHDYGHPRPSFVRIAALWTALLDDKLNPGAHITPEDVARLMVALKLSRDVNRPKRDNRVDAIGYLISLDRLETGR